MAVTLAMEASLRCVHGNSYSFYPLPRAYGNEYELVWWFDSTLCYKREQVRAAVQSTL
jgi:hypothetical protein